MRRRLRDRVWLGVGYAGTFGLTLSVGLMEFSPVWMLVGAAGAGLLVVFFVREIGTLARQNRVVDAERRRYFEMLARLGTRR